MNTRINISGIFGLIGKSIVIGTLGAGFFAFVGNMVEEDKAERESAANMVLIVNESTFIIADTDTIRVTRNNTSHLFNYQYRHITVRGKVEDYSIDAEFSFDEFDDSTRIDETLRQGCTIARDFAAKTYDISKTHEDLIKKQEIAARFAANHCKLPAPGGSQ